MTPFACLIYIKNYKDWYYVNIAQVLQHGGQGLLARYSWSLIQALRAIFPQEVWHSYRFSKPHQIEKGSAVFGKVQYLLFQHVQSVSCKVLNVLPCKLFPGFTVDFNYQYAHTKKYVQFDVVKHKVNINCCLDLRS